MKIILQQDYPRLGAALDVMEVKDGYARNFLIPQGIAVPATKGNLRHTAEMQKYNAKRVERSIAAAKTVAAAAVAHTCLIPVKVKVGDDIYGSVSIQDIVDNFATAGIEIPKTSVLLSSPIKRLGAYDVVVKLHKTVSVTIKVVVVNELAPVATPVAVEQLVEQTEEA